jgi:nicotinate-nucleotide adenylyltransferase
MGLLGGTFDPVHYGHLDAAEAARASLALDAVTFIPSHLPPHRPAQPRASAFQRFALLALALQGRAGCRLSDVELLREGPSFTIDTLRVFHQSGLGPLQLFFILGADAFAEVATWHEYPAVLDAANFAVMARPGSSIEDALARTPDVRTRVRPEPPHEGSLPRTAVFLVRARTRDVSSTDVRARIAAGDSIEGLVPPAVARHISSHHLYERVDELHG